jgi:hypothetical protein
MLLRKHTRKRNPKGEKMKRIVIALLCTIILLALSCRMVASESGSTVINVQIFPPMAEADSGKSNWTLEFQLIQKTMAKDPNGKEVIINEQIIGRKGKVADNEGKVTWTNNLVQRPKESIKHEQLRYCYKVVCFGGWAYSEGSSKELDAEIPNIYDITINMERK